jgi:site-specific recombinase XerD
MKNLKIKTYHIESKSNDKNEAPVYLRIILDGRFVQMSTGIFLTRDRWDHKKKEVKSKHPDAVKLNLQIAKAKERLHDIHYELQRTGKPTLERIKDIWTGKEQKTNTIMALIDYNNNQVKEKIGSSYAVNTYRHYCSLRTTVASFINSTFGKVDYDLEGLNLAFISKFEHYLQSVNHNSVNTVAKQIDRLKTVINLGIKSDWLKDNPFKNYTKKTVPSSRKFLTIEEINAIDELDLSYADHLERVRDIFIFICYTGISYCDLATLKADNIIKSLDGNRIIRLERKKTLEACSIPLLPRSEQIVVKYSNHPMCQNKGILLPVISNQKMNDYLKIIGKHAEINKPVTCHVGRHSFATMSLERGVPIETVSKVLGHRSVKTTQIYGKITNTKISKDYSQFYSKQDDHQKRVV